MSGGGGRLTAPLGGLPVARLAVRGACRRARRLRCGRTVRTMAASLAACLYDVDLVKEKLTHPAVRAELRLAIFAPAAAPLADVQARLAHLVAAYRSHDLERGNGLVARPLERPETVEALCSPLPIGPPR